MLVLVMAIINEDSLASLAFANGIGPARRNSCVRKMWFANLNLLAACLFDGRFCAKFDAEVFLSWQVQEWHHPGGQHVPRSV
jgi:hypothetical protein